MSIITRSPEAIRDNILTHIRGFAANIVTAAQSFLWHWAYAIAREIHLMWVYLAQEEAERSRTTATSTGLDIMAGNLGIARTAAVKAKGTVRYSRAIALPSTDVIIPRGHKTATRSDSSGNSLYFVTTAQGTLFRGTTSVDIAAEAVVAGQKGNVAVDTVVVAPDGLPTGIEAVSNPMVFSNGADAEDTATFRANIPTRFRGQNYGTGDAFRAAALKDTGATDALVIEPAHALSRGYGKVDVIVKGDANATVTDVHTYVAGTNDYILAQQPVKSITTVVGRVEMDETLNRTGHKVFKLSATVDPANIEEATLGTQETLTAELDKMKTSDNNLFVYSSATTNGHYAFLTFKVKFSGNPANLNTILTQVEGIGTNGRVIKLWNASTAAWQTVVSDTASVKTILEATITSNGGNYLVTAGSDRFLFLLVRTGSTANGTTAVTLQIDFMKTVFTVNSHTFSASTDYALVLDTDTVRVSSSQARDVVRFVSTVSAGYRPEHNTAFTTTYMADGVVTGAAKNINTCRSLTEDVLARQAAKVTVNVTATVTAATGENATAVRTAVATAITSFFTVIGIGKNVLVVDLLATMRGVSGVANVTMSAPSADVAITAKQVATAGTVTIS